MNHPDNLMYTSEHEWVKIENNIATVGILILHKVSLEI